MLPRVFIFLRTLPVSSRNYSGHFIAHFLDLYLTIPGPISSHLGNNISPSEEQYLTIRDQYLTIRDQYLAIWGLVDWY